MTAKHDNETLFQPLRIGAIELPHRIVMAPLTRVRATDRVPNALMEEYYCQRSSAALIISEATAISEQGYGWHGAPGIYTAEHVEGWKRIADSVHASGGRMFLQLWHMGRVSHPDYQGGRLPVGPSPIAATGEAHTPTGKKPYVVPQALSAKEIARVIDDYAEATGRARDAGFDGVEIHGANGYLIDQFLRDSANQRTDQYGGSIENRLRFLREVVTAVTDVWSADRTGVRLSPTMSGNGMADSDPIELYSRAARMLNRFQLAYLHIAEAIRPGRLFNADAPRVTPSIRAEFEGVLFANGGYEKSTAANAVRTGEADAVVFGQKFIANPDLPARLRDDAPLNEPEVATYYAPGAHGYTDYPSLVRS
ncbi:alkene reductase [Allorhodopirellula heiligendammensis]|uniref:N-ethylmaleimide reductase n=1 Tax=Allorhodopirellula heiligendammensis TaxID=2714739 RepID=A0A5C6C728_9BACT|nr:alkene reductase [Allorhodopirellula heiligendammensis]TWU19922.1 N-ethylmaleimide reductase [Allorhodopirellula heiligendammensis]